MRLPTVKPKMVIRALKRDGFIVHHTTGSHYIMKKENLRVTVPYHNKGLEAWDFGFNNRSGGANN